MTATLRDLGEFELIRAITARFARGRDVLVGPGDDAAVLAAPDARVVVTTDLLLEGRHFRRDWSSGVDVGHKAAAQNLADVAAMGARPTGLFVGFAAPGDLPVDWALALADGLAAECALAGASVAGGDISSADAIMLGVTALGDLEGRAPVLRSGARPGDVVVLAGSVGRAEAGLALLTAGRGHDADADVNAGWAGLVSAHRRPRPPYPLGPALAAAGAHAMCDVSDGLVQDLGHIAAASQVRIDLDLAALAALTDLTGLAADGPLRSAAAELGADPLDWVLTGGEDHALVACLPPSAVIPAGCEQIGLVLPGSGVTLAGRPAVGRGGWNHFA
ncbi:thiamine-phosphate kinase [Frankia tisae]|uniref:thiamine-phosphate kinase n=1 Tax=Frankia tisae TaxID=2950104 RepID=UPI0021BFA891|nr:thiamine-phosphate kinase [Frankia tisae]